MAGTRYETLVQVMGKSLVAFWDSDDEGDPIVRRVVDRNSNKDFVSPKIYDAVRAELVKRMTAQLAHAQRAANWRGVI